MLFKSYIYNNKNQKWAGILRIILDAQSKVDANSKKYSRKKDVNIISLEIREWLIGMRVSKESHILNKIIKNVYDTTNKIRVSVLDKKKLF